MTNEILHIDATNIGDIAKNCYNKKYVGNTIVIDGKDVRDARRKYSMEVERLLFGARKYPFKIVIDNIELSSRYIRAIYACLLNPCKENEDNVRKTYGLS